MRRAIREVRATYQTDEAIIAAAMQIMERRLAKRTAGTKFTDPTQVAAMIGDYAKLAAGDATREYFMVFYLDTKHRLIHHESLHQGTVDGCEVHPREVTRGALQHNAAAVILAHNHPSGDTDPSAADRVVTARIKQSLALVDVRLLDHFVVGVGVPVSMAARGLV